MAEHSYKAYISYSHSDEAWGAWLQRALELYRVPRKLVGKETGAGQVPARIRPVFRDREDLSSAVDLKVTVKQSLANSENMIVICSPEAVASRWVNEEIREFAALGRADRIFCIIVDGEPVGDGSLSSCFPAALAEIGHQEPLAADVRNWADGKYVAKLKVIAGLLGLRLDELRQRDLQRRRKRQVMMALAFVAVLTLAGMTVISQISERHEREKAEQLATFVVDLGERLKSDADLETLALISAEASRHLQSLNPDKLSPATGVKVALALRQMGQVSQSQAKPDEALEAFQRSRDVLAVLHAKHQDIPDLLFQLGNAEYYIGNLHFMKDDLDSAVLSMRSYHRLTGELYAMDPDNPDWILELSYSHNNLAALQLTSGNGIDEETLKHVAEAIRLMEMVVVLRPGDQAMASVYSTTLAWAADAQFQTCNLKEAYSLRKKALELAAFASREDPGNNDLKKHYAYALTGVASLQNAIGMSDASRQNLGLAISMLEQLSAADPSNVHLQEESLYRKVQLFGQLAGSGQLEVARPMVMEIESAFQLVGGFTGKSIRRQNEYIDYLLAHADVEFQSAKIESSKQLLQTATQLYLAHSDSLENDISDTKRLVNARYQWWRLTGENNKDVFSATTESSELAQSEFRSCNEADSNARMSIIKEDRISASSEVSYLMTRGYANPGFMRFCELHGLCGG
jgi:tetratricopeptide (TPR) repeat protein